MRFRTGLAAAALALTITPQASAEDTVTNLSVVAKGPEKVIPGRTARWTFKVTNAGPGIARSARLDVRFPYLATATGDGCGSRRGTITCRLGTVGYGETRSLSVMAAVDRDAIGTLSVSATVSARTEDPGSGDDTFPLEIQTRPRADLEIRGRASRLAPGRRAAYTFTVYNHGPSTARTVRILDRLHRPLTAISVKARDCKLWRNGFRCHWARLGRSRKITMRVKVSGRAGGRVTNWITVRAATPDPATANNRAKLTVRSR